MSVEQQPKRNKYVEKLLIGDMEIEPMFALSAFFAYEREVAAATNGAGFYELGIKDRWRMQQMSILTPSDASRTTSSRYEIHTEGVTQPNSIALIPISGVMQTHGGASSRGADSIAQDIRAAYANDNIVGVILEINSGGGESMAGNLLSSVVKERNKPVVTLAHLAASAAYRVSASTDEIIASSDSVEFGSIGTMLTIDNELVQEYRDKMTEFYGADAPEKNSDWRDLIAGDANKLQARVDELTKRFHNQIRADRELKGDATYQKKTLSGAVFPTPEAKKRGLVDFTGDLNLAVARVEALKRKYKKM